VAGTTAGRFAIVGIVLHRTIIGLCTCDNTILITYRKLATGVPETKSREQQVGEDEKYRYGFHGKAANTLFCN